MHQKIKTFLDAVDTHIHVPKIISDPLTGHLNVSVLNHFHRLNIKSLSLTASVCDMDRLNLTSCNAFSVMGLRLWICICQLSHLSPTKTHSWEHIRNMSRIFKNVLGMCWEHVRNCGSITLSKLPDTLHVTSRLMNIHSYLRLPVSVHCFIFNSWCRCSESAIGKRLT